MKGDTLPITGSGGMLNHESIVSLNPFHNLHACSNFKAAVLKCAQGCGIATGYIASSMVIEQHPTAWNRVRDRER